MPIRNPRYKSSLFGFITILGGSCLLNSISLHAAEYDYLIEATALAEKIENPGRTHIPGEDEFLSQQKLRGTLSRATSKLITNIDYQGIKSNYREDILTDRTQVTGASSIEWIISPERLSWNLTNSRSLQVIDALAPDTPDNRQVISLTTTGPRATLQLTGRDKLSGSVNYSIADYERSLLSRQDRTTADLLLSHSFSTRYISSIGGNYLSSKVDEAPLFDFERYEYFWQNQYVTEIFDVSLILGQNVLVRDDFADQENFLVRLSGNYKLNSQSSFSFNYSDSYEDVFSDMTRLPSDPGQVFGDLLGTSALTQNYQLVKKGITYRYLKSEFFNMSFGYTEAERTYDGAVDLRDQVDKIFSAAANWKLFENIDFGLYGRHARQEFSDFDREQKRNEFGLKLAYRISKSLYTQFITRYVEQNGTLEDDDYDGMNYSISLTYVLGN